MCVQTNGLRRHCAFRWMLPKEGSHEISCNLFYRIHLLDKKEDLLEHILEPSNTCLSILVDEIFQDDWVRPESKMSEEARPGAL